MVNVWNTKFWAISVQFFPKEKVGGGGADISFALKLKYFVTRSLQVCSTIFIKVILLGQSSFKRPPTISLRIGVPGFVTGCTENDDIHNGGSISMNSQNPRADFPAVFSALSWSTNENPSTDKLSRAIN